MSERNRIFKVLDERPDTATHPIQPCDIPNLSPSDYGLLQTFGKIEVERAAERLVHFFVQQGCWCRFTLPQLLSFYMKHGWSINSPFFGLMGAWFHDGGMMGWVEPLDVFIACDDKGHYFVTDRFVERCSRAQARDPGPQRRQPVFNRAN